MAGRGGPKLKEYRTAITSIKQWQSEVSHPLLSVVEVYSSSFGACQVILPTINSIMTNLGEGAENKVKWLTINVGKLEEEQKAADEEEQKKQSEQQMDAAGKRGKTAAAIAPAVNLPAADSTHIVIDTMEQKEQPLNQSSTADDDDTAENNTADTADTQPASQHSAATLDVNTPTVPLLEAYHAYDHPRPLWLFFLAGQFQYELTSANPPKMLKLVQACLSGEKLSAEDLQGMELQTDSAEVAAEKRRKRLQKKKEEEEVKRKQKELEDAQQAKKKREIVRTTPEYLLHLSLSSYTNQTAEGVSATGDVVSTKQPIVVLYWKDGESDYYYHSQTARAAATSDGSVVFPQSLVFKKADTAEAESHIELRVCLYEVEDDEPIKGEREGQGLLGEGYVLLSALTAGQSEVRIVHRDLSVPPLSPTAKSPRAVKVDKLMALATIKAKERVSEGTLSDYRFTVAINGLAAPSAPADAATPANAYTVKLHALDDNSPVYVLQSTTEACTTQPLAFTTPLTATHYSGLPRQLRFTLHSDDGAVINTADVSFASLVGRGGSAVLGAADAAGGASSVEFVLRVDEVDEDGNVIAPTAAALSDEEKARQAALQWLQLTFTADNVNPASVTQSAIVAVYHEGSDGAMSLLGATEPLAAAAALSWQQTLFVPRDEVVKRKYKAVLVDAANASVVTGAAIVGQHVFDLAWLPPQAEQSTVQQTTDLPLETTEGLPVDGECKLHIAAVSVGQLQTLSLSFAVSALELAEGDAAVNAIVAVYRVQNGVKQLVGQTERVVGSAPFTRAVDVTSYTDSACPLQLCVYNATADDVLVESELVAECTLNAEQIRYTDNNTATVPLTTTTLLKQGESTITVTNNAAVERPAAPEQQQPATEEAAAAQPDQPQEPQQPEATPATEDTTTQQPPAEPTTEEQPAAHAAAAAEVSAQPTAAAESKLQTLAFTFNAKGVKGVEGDVTLALHSVDSVTGSEVELGRTTGTVAGERIWFVTPIALLAFSAGQRQVRVVLSAGDSVVGEASVPVDSLTHEKSTANKFPLTKAGGESTGATVSIRVNAHAEDPEPVSVPSTPAVGLSPRPPASPAAKPPVSPSATVFKAPLSPAAKPAGSSSTRTTPRAASKAPSTHTTPKVTPRAAASEVPRKPSVSLSRKPSVSKKEEEQKAPAAEHSRQASRSVSKKSPVVTARKEAQPVSAAHSRQTSRSVSKKSESAAAPSEVATAAEAAAPEAAATSKAATPRSAVAATPAAAPAEPVAAAAETVVTSAESTAAQPVDAAGSTATADSESKVAAETAGAAQPIEKATGEKPAEEKPQAETVEQPTEAAYPAAHSRQTSQSVSKKSPAAEAQTETAEPAVPAATEAEAAEDDYADDTHAESAAAAAQDEPTNDQQHTATEAAIAIDSHPQQDEDDYKDDTEPTAADETVPGTDAHAVTEGSEPGPQAQPTAAEEKAEGAQQEAAAVQADVVASNEGEGKKEASVAASEDDYADDTEAEAAAE